MIAADLMYRFDVPSMSIGFRRSKKREVIQMNIKQELEKMEAEAKTMAREAEIVQHNLGELAWSIRFVREDLEEGED